MISNLLKQMRIAILLLLLMTILCGIVYPLAITGIANLAFPKEANGSIITKNGQLIGSELVGQYFTDTKYFWGRPPAASLVPYAVLGTGGSNLGPTNPDLYNNIQQRIAALNAVSPNQNDLIPIDLVTASASGIDPEISPLACYYQIPRVAKARGLTTDAVEALVLAHIKDRQFGFLGEPRVNVLQLNLALDDLAAAHH